MGEGGEAQHLIFLFSCFDLNFRIKLIFDIFGLDDFFVWAGGGVPDPIFIGLNNLVRVKLGYTSNFTFLGLLEVPYNFVWWWWVGRWVVRW